jgi:phosphoribosyl 1,2-cyclic phosphodiesterase
METNEFYARIWGVRGSIPCPGPDTLRYGGNTPCIELRCGPHLLILDAGTGMRPLGDSLRGAPPLVIDVLLSHSHFDHICGLPFFLPAFTDHNKMRIWAGHLAPERGIQAALGLMMADPLFPIPIEALRCETRFFDFVAGATIVPRPGLLVRTAALNHPNRATGYRIDFAGKSICYITDTEHFADGPDQRIVALVAGADFVIYDAMFTDAEYPQKIGWGHSTWEAGIRLVEAAGAKTLVVFHHAPSRNDDDLDAIAAAAAAARPGTLVAAEGMVLRPE